MNWKAINGSRNGGPGIAWAVQSDDGSINIRVEAAPDAEKLAYEIAALPDLLEALRELVASRERRGSTHGDYIGVQDGSDGRYARARAALAKAERK